jgi:hypothetical protein
MGPIPRDAFHDLSRPRTPPRRATVIPVIGRLRRDLSGPNIALP